MGIALAIAIPITFAVSALSFCYLYLSTKRRYMWETDFQTLLCGVGWLAFVTILLALAIVA